MQKLLPFPHLHSARANLKPGTCYAIDGGDAYIYFGQVAFKGECGFFRHRSQNASLPEALAAPLMSRFGVLRSSIGAALRLGKWLYLAQQEVNVVPFARS